MSKYLTLIPLLREMCFPYYHSCLEKKMTMILGNGNFYVFSFGNWANVIWVMNMKPCILLLFHSPSVILKLFFVLHLFLFSLYGRLYVPIPCGESRLYPSSIFFFFKLFLSISVYMAGDKMAATSFDRLHWFTLLPRPSGFSLSPFQAYSSQYLPVLSKCYCKVFQWDDSKYVYINRGNTLGYILLTPCVAWSLYRLIVSRFDLSNWTVRKTCTWVWFPTLSPPH